MTTILNWWRRGWSMVIDVNVDERHLNTGQDEIEAPRAKNPGKCFHFKKVSLDNTC